MRKPLLLTLCLPFLCAAADPFTVKLLSTASTPQPVGTSIGLTPLVEGGAPTGYVYRYSVSENGGPFHIVRDFTQFPTFAWTPSLYEHEARVRLTVRDKSSATADAEATFRITPRATGNRPVVTQTAHPLVALFSAPPCPEGKQIRVAFRPAGASTGDRTSTQACRGKLTSNFYIAGMRPDSAYQLRDEILTGDQVKAGDWLSFHTGLIDGDFPPVSVSMKANRGPVAEPLLIHSISATDPTRPFATDLEGNIVWYLRQPALLTRVLPNGHFLSLEAGMNSANDMRRLQVIREYDLAGNPLRETNISRVAEQLTKFGIHSDCKKGGEECVSSFHHEAIRLPNGHTLAVGGLERMMPAGTQGAKTRVDILGDIIVDLDEDFQVAWLWNSFDHMDLKRRSIDDAKCQGGPGRGGCAAVFLADTSNGWLHSNSLNYVPSDGSVLVSMPEQDWVLKLDYQNGKGSGKVLWRLGKDGDFKAKSTDPEPWFSYQHDPGFEPVGSDTITILDDGHERAKKHPDAKNRGQVWKLDEKNKIAELIYNADLGVYAVAVGAAQRLSNGGYSFEAGFINPGPFARAIETSPDGRVVYSQQVDGVVDYRSFRVKDLYSGATK
jgi:arylsulfate sulfotransferase